MNLTTIRQLLSDMDALRLRLEDEVGGAAVNIAVSAHNVGVTAIRAAIAADWPIGQGDTSIWICFNTPRVELALHWSPEARAAFGAPPLCLEWRERARAAVRADAAQARSAEDPA